MKRFQLSKNKFIRLLINVGLIFGWFVYSISYGFWQFKYLIIKPIYNFSSCGKLTWGYINCGKYLGNV